MTHGKPGLGLLALLACSVIVTPASAQQLNPQQVQLITNTAASICNTIKEAKGQKDDLQLQGDVKAELTGLLGKLVGAGAGVGAKLNQEQFEGLSREATATALQGDRDCRERVFIQMFNSLQAVREDATKNIGDRLVGSYQVILGPRGGCNGGVPNSYPRQLARIVSDGNSLIAYNECGSTTTISIADEHTIYFFGERGELDFGNGGVLIKADDGNSWQKVRAR
jgi:hypothetical protein